MNEKNKTSSSVVNAITSLVFIVSNGLLGLFFVKYVISCFGSDYNGINSSSTQLVNVLLVLEGGFTLATNVALFAPINAKKYDAINSILSATKHRFIQIGSLFLSIGILLSFVYAGIIKTDAPYYHVVILFLMAIIPNGINLLVAIKYKSILLSDQREYIISLSTLLTTVLGYVLSFVLMKRNCGIWAIKIGSFIFTIVNIVFLYAYVRRKYPFINYNVAPDFDSIKGTKDVFISKITGAAYAAFPVFIISVFFSGGSKLVSVYAVYASVFSLISNAIMAFTSAPRFAFGSLFAENRIEYIKHKFKEYELICFSVTSTLLGTTIILILPFVELYTRDVNDFDYVDKWLPLILSITSYVSFIHIPSGHMINMSGHFRESKRINIIAFLCLVFVMSFFTCISIVYELDIYFILIGICLSGTCLALLEIAYAHNRVMKLRITESIRLMIPSFIVVVVSEVVALLWNVSIENYWFFALYGCVISCLILVLTLFLNYLINKQVLKTVLHSMVKRMGIPNLV